ncbi:MAG TPA: poly(R)-hydroxyalkanoic acid synthase subunit PhaE [Bacteroidia bacterium]|nr:poly(R)-hydroxyalkanoic acid synthase subunit PhaE [Bacteroidia bacterium]
MKTNPIFENLIEAQTQAVNNWVDSTKKFQSAFTSGSIPTEGQSIYKEWLDKQMNLFSGVQANFAKNGDGAKPEEFFKNWYNQQLEQVKKMTDFNQSLQTSFANFGKNPADYAANFSQANQAWTNIYNNWMGALNSTYDTFAKSMPNGVNKDSFKNFFEGTQSYLKLQEFWQPMFESFKGGNFNADTLKKMYQPDAYKQITEQLFNSFFHTSNMKDVFDASIKKIQDFFSNQNNLSKEYTAAFKNIANEYPQLVGGDFGKLSEMYKNANNVFAKSFEPVLKLAGAGKEKEAIEENIVLLDKIAEFSVKQAELQFHLYNTTQKAVETTSKKALEKFEKLSPEELKGQSFNEFYNEWVKTNESLFTDLFASEDFSKVKGELINVSMDVKKHFEKQFENVFNVYPVVFRSEVDELYQTIHDLKKQVKALETRLAVQGAASLSFDDDKAAKAKKK